MANPRLIDRDSRVRTKPMKVLVLGLCRTGTTSIYFALKRLGYTPHHMRECMNEPGDLDLWTEALRTRSSGQGESYGRSEFDKLLGDYDAVTDLPGAIFVKELVSAYPEAKVVLSTRDLDKWHGSMLSTLWAFHHWPSMRFLASYDKRIARPHGFMDLFFKSFCHGDPGEPMREAYLAHNAAVLESKGEVLEYNVSEGWGPLCKFLGVPVPEEEFPRINETRDFLQHMRKVRNFAAVMVLGKALAKYVLPAVVGGAVFYYYRRDRSLRAVVGWCFRL